MAKLAIGFGIVLMLLGIAGFILTGSTHPTSLIPTWFGIVLVLCGILANTPDTRRRMLWMHIAVTVSLLGFLFPGFMAVKELVAAGGGPLAHAAAVEEQASMAVVCLIFTALCVRSFIVARRSRAV